MFTEVYHPIVNGVVTSIDALRAGLRHDGIEVVTFAPHARLRADEDDDDDGGVVRFPSLPLPTTTGYRLCVPYLRASARARMRSLDIAHAHSPFVSGWLAASHARRARIPLIYTYHTQFDAYAHYAPFGARFTRAAMVTLTRTFANCADAVIAPTHAMHERLRAFGVTTRIDVVPSAIDVERFAGARRSNALRAQLGGGDEGTSLILAVARLGREKNLAVAIDAMACAEPDVRLAIVGAGPERAELERRIAASGLGNRVRLAGAFPATAMPAVYASADAFVFTSVTDTQGLVLAEAQAAGIPVAAVDSPVAREMLGVRARFAPSDPRALAAVLREILTGSNRPAPVVDARLTIASHAASVRGIYQALRAESPKSTLESDQSAVHLAP